MGDYSPKFKPGMDITLSAGGAVVGGQLLVVSGVNTVVPSSATSPVVAGVARQDAASGEKVVVCRGGVQKIVASGAVTAADRVAPAAAGRCATNATNSFGTALNTVADGGTVLVLMDK
jgi:hypothetical protein